MGIKRPFWALLLTVLASIADAQSNFDIDALNVADGMTVAAARSSDWNLFVDTSTSSTQVRDGNTSQTNRLSLDIRFDGAIASGWRLVFADRLDISRQSAPTAEIRTNTLKEAYASWQTGPDISLDIGRINARLGVATGFNPTDFFKANALRSITSVDPASLRENRLGTGMVRTQALWEGGSGILLYAPKLASVANSDTWNPDFGATNHDNRWLFAASQQLASDFTPQILLFGGDEMPTQFGFNVTRLFSDALVGYIEWSGGKGVSLQARAANQTASTSNADRFYARVATGATYTTENNISLTLEYDYNGAANDRSSWSELDQLPFGATLQYVGYAKNVQDLSTRHAGFVYLTWQNALIKHLDVTAMLRLDLDRGSRSAWLESRYHWKQADLALQWQSNVGRSRSAYGAIPERSMVQLLYRYFFF